MIYNPKGIKVIDDGKPFQIKCNSCSVMFEQDGFTDDIKTNITLKICPDCISKKNKSKQVITITDIMTNPDLIKCSRCAKKGMLNFDLNDSGEPYSLCKICREKDKRKGIENQERLRKEYEEKENIKKNDTNLYHCNNCNKNLTRDLFGTTSKGTICKSCKECDAIILDKNTKKQQEIDKHLLIDPNQTLIKCSTCNWNLPLDMFGQNKNELNFKQCIIFHYLINRQLKLSGDLETIPGQS